MAKVDNHKLTNKESPCKAPQPCLDQRDYDPCESGGDITETDLAMLLKEEQDRLRRDKERAEGDKRRGRGSEAGKGSEDGVGTEWKEEEKGKGGEEEGGKGREGVGRGRPCHRGKRPPCRKREETNPFFTDRLGFSSDLPPPPPVPPPQFFPPVDGSEAKICPKRRKKCRKGGREKGKEKVVGTGAVSSSSGMGGAEEQVEEEKEKEEEAAGAAECKCLYEDECKEEGTDDGGGMVERVIRKGRCKKRARDRPPCRKKVSEVSISLQPRHIPALQRDLPPASPKDIPEVVRQILMACGNECSVDCGRRKCKKPHRCK